MQTDPISDQEKFVDAIKALDKALLSRFQQKIALQPTLSRALVTFQANKTRAVYRWYKYKEAFSAALVEHFINRYTISCGPILDPFAGSGTTLFAASAMGLEAEGIELLPIGQQIITARKMVLEPLSDEEIARLQQWSQQPVWQQDNNGVVLTELRITRGAYPEQTKLSIERYIASAQNETKRLQTILQFALLCVLESVSFTRKDGQYLRWDYRSGRTQGKEIFDKGPVLDFEQAIGEKLQEIITDVLPSSQPSLFTHPNRQGQIRLYSGSCLNLLPNLPDNHYEAIITSPPYCNRYDYTRTYALELALLEVDESGLIKLRQEMLSCTVENRPKELLNINPLWITALKIAEGQDLLQAIIHYLEQQKTAGRLNNNGIPRMIKGYFYEMVCIMAETFRTLKPGGLVIMINDNVRYAGIPIAVDLILADFAEKIGFCVENIFVLPNGKGNSSQQMGKHGREELRKSIYVWRKP